MNMIEENVDHLFKKVHIYEKDYCYDELQDKEENKMLWIKEDKTSIIKQDDALDLLCFSSEFEDLFRFPNVEVKQASPSKLDALTRALSLNTQLKQLVIADLEKVKVAYQQNLKKQVLLKAAMNFSKDEAVGETNHFSQISKFAAPYFRDVKDMVAPPNDDTKIKKRRSDVNAYLKSVPWSESESQKLSESVAKFSLMAVLEPYIKKRAKYKTHLYRLKTKGVLSNEVEELKKQRADILKTIKSLREKPVEEHIDATREKFDWMTISATYMNGIRNPDECEYMWNNCLNNLVNKQRFTKDEDEKLLLLALKYEERNWDVIASKLKSGRTAFQCFHRFESKLRKTVNTKLWSEKDDKKLLHCVKEFAYGDKIPWWKVAYFMESCTASQCQQRYKSLCTVYRGPWTVQEDAMHIACYAKFEKKWLEYQPFFKRRSYDQIRLRFCSMLDPALIVGPWTLDEDKQLIELIREHGHGKWKEISEFLPNRNRRHCCKRASVLLKNSIKYHEKKYNKDVDPTVHDPKFFAKILRPLQKSCYLRKSSGPNNTRRANAMRLLSKVIEKVLPEFEIKVVDLSSNDFSFLSLENLHTISEDLHHAISVEDKELPMFSQQTPQFKKGCIRNNRLSYDEVYGESDSDNNIDNNKVINDELEASPVKELSCKEIKTSDSALAAMIKLRSKNQCIIPSMPGSHLYQREHAEMSLYKTFLFKQFNCLSVHDDDDNIEDVTFDKVDYSETLPFVVNHFIQPPIYKNQFVVLAPNMQSIFGMEMMEQTEDRLLKMSECLSHSDIYIDYLCEKRRSCPKCIQCFCKDDKVYSEDDKDYIFQNATTYMEDNDFLVTETMKTAARVEAASAEKSSEACSCKALQESLSSVQLLRKRFRALFLWPTLLSMSPISEERGNSLFKAEKPKDYFIHPRICDRNKDDRGIKKANAIRARRRLLSDTEEVEWEPKSKECCAKYKKQMSGLPRKRTRMSVKSET